ncbi:MAG: hypothetical protein LBS74_09440 [Oscillospiraceae bacterium]|nr:hypothetical protein [Oscillospiraceae bacterium]
MELKQWINGEILPFERDENSSFMQSELEASSDISVEEKLELLFAALEELITITMEG